MPLIPVLVTELPNIQRFKRVVAWAVEIGWVKVHGFQTYSCALKKSRRKKFTFYELAALEAKHFEDPLLSFVKDLFVFSCYTGLAFADVTRLTRSDLERDEEGTVWCKIYRAKSEALSPVPLLPTAVELLARYRQDATNKKRTTIFPRITNQQVSRALKTIRDACDIDTPMTFHVARLTFAKTVALRNGVPLETVQMMLGHVKISTTQIYADIDDEKILDDMVLLGGKLAAKNSMA